MEALTQEEQIEELKAEKKQVSAEIKLTKKEAEYHLALERWKEELTEIRIYYIAEDNKFFYWNGKSWITSLTKESVQTRFGIRNAAEYSAFIDAMRYRGRVKDRGVYSFFEDDSVCLNMTNRDMWLKPVQGEVNPIFDIILNSLSDGRKDIRDHIEQVIYWKWKHPEDYKIPCMVIYGEGGLGKNEFIERVLTSLFNGGQVKALPANMVVGDYTGMIKGNVVTYVDELYGATKQQMNKFKELVGNRTVNVNNKGGRQEDIPATSLVITGGNKLQGALLLDGTSSDRRWSVIHCRRNIVLHTMLLDGVDISKYETMAFSDMKEIEEYQTFETFMNDNMKYLSDPVQVAAWLYDLEAKWGNLEQCPTAYHGEDYKNLLGAQKNILEDFCDAVFGHPGFSNISTTAFFDAYKLYVHENGSAYDIKNIRQRKQIILDAVEYILSAGLNVQHVQKKDNVKIYHNGVKKNFTGFKTIMWGKKPERQDHEILTVDKFYNTKLSEAWFENDGDDIEKNDGNIISMQ